MMGFLFHLSLLAVPATTAFVRPSKCLPDFNVGSTPCSEDAPVRYYYDTEMDRCHAFRYTGCGGNENMFNERRECEKTCFDPERTLCPGNAPPTLNVLGSPTNCTNQRNSSIPLCEGFKNWSITFSTGYCNTNGIGQCCSVKDLRKVHPDVMHAFCPDGRDKQGTTMPYSNEVGYVFTSVILGKNCDTNFCDDGFECVMGNFYSYCCRKP